MNPEVAYSGLLENAAIVGQLVLIALLLERGLAFIFEYHWFAKISERIEGLKAPITFAVALTICNRWNLDILAEIFREEGAPDNASWMGFIMTAAIVSGGSAGVMSLFESWFGWSRKSRKAKTEARTAGEEAELAEKSARLAYAEAELNLAMTKALESGKEYDEVATGYETKAGSAKRKEFEKKFKAKAGR